MNDVLADLHTHSTASDGSLTPTQLMQAAAAVGLGAIALTDHDTGNGLAEAQAEANRLGIKFVPGIEISAEFPLPGTLHILGHFVDADSPGLAEMSRILLEGRNERNPKIIKRLNELGCRITMEQVEQMARGGRAATAGAPNVSGAAVMARKVVPTPSSASWPAGHTGLPTRASAPLLPETADTPAVPAERGERGGSTLGRAHMAQVLVANGCVASIKQAFDVYLGAGGAAYFDKERLTPRQAIDCIHKAGGLATVAHPVQLKGQNPAHYQTMINHLVEAGLDGIEVWHSDHTERDTALFLALAERYDLVTTGGSDFHGRAKLDVALARGRSNVQVPMAVYERLEERWRSRVSRDPGDRVV